MVWRNLRSSYGLAFHLVTTKESFQEVQRFFVACAFGVALLAGCGTGDSASSDTDPPRAFRAFGEAAAKQDGDRLWRRASGPATSGGRQMARSTHGARPRVRRRPRVRGQRSSRGPSLDRVARLGERTRSGGRRGRRQLRTDVQGLNRWQSASRSAQRRRVCRGRRAVGSDRVDVRAVANGGRRARSGP